MPEVKLTVRDSQKRETTITKEIAPEAFATSVERMIKNVDEIHIKKMYKIGDSGREVYEILAIIN